MRRVKATFAITPGALFSSLSGKEIGSESNSRTTVMHSVNFTLDPDLYLSFKAWRMLSLTAGAGYRIAFGNAGNISSGDLGGLQLSLGVSAVTETYGKWEKVMNYHYAPPTSLNTKPGKHPKRSSFSKQHSDALSAKQRHRNRLESLEFWKRKKESDREKKEEDPKNDKEEQE
jgi:hypothetical protein